MGNSRKLRKKFEIIKRFVTLSYNAYDVKCLVNGCEFESKGWDYRRNALDRGWSHVISQHRD